MPETREAILTSIDRSSESSPRPAFWLRGLVGSALALPFLVGLGLGNRSTEPPELAVRESGYIAMNKLRPSDNTANRPPRAKVAKDRPKRKAPKPANEISKDDELAALFGLGPKPGGDDAAATDNPGSDGTSTPIAGLKGLDVTGWPGEETPPAGGSDTIGQTTANLEPGGDPDGATIEDPDTEPAPPEITDLSALMNYTTDKVTTELEKSFPAVKQGGSTTLRYTNGSSVTGQVLNIGPTLLSMNVNSQRVTVYFNALEPSSRILVDRAYRQAEVMKEVEKRMLDAIK